jgi:2-polyprenyl-6-methoxyphenol hydroxylase-like FAD-dependent oxidoreductase
MHTPILIIGAGPTGLMMACQLRRMGVDCITVDSKKGPTEESRAVVVQTRTLEIYDQMDLAAQAMAQGAPMRQVQVYGPRGRISMLPFQDLGKGLSKFPEALIFEQSKNEALLYEDLRKHGGEVLWEHELTGLSQDESGVTATLKDAGGAIQTVSVDWLFAADGARSFVRHHLQLSFSGGTYEHIFFVADTALPAGTPWRHDSLSIYFSRKAFLALFPMRGDRRFRAIGALPKSYQNEAPKSFEEISPLVEAAVKLPLRFEDTRWFSVYRLHHRHVQRFRAERIFLGGDAAHIHSPVGGQGMNTGLQDAYNLAWKLAFVVRGQLKPEVLDSYEQERLPVAEYLLKSTDRGFVMVNSQKPIPTLLRTVIVPYLLPLLMRIRLAGRWIFRTVSQIAIRYPKSMLSKRSEFHSLKEGMRIPYVLLNDRRDLQEHMKAMKFHLLILAAAEEAAGIAKRFDGFHKEILELLPIHEASVRRALGIREAALLLVRPDHHLACAVPVREAGQIEDFLHGICTD